MSPSRLDTSLTVISRRRVAIPSWTCRLGSGARTGRRDRPSRRRRAGGVGTARRTGAPGRCGRPGHRLGRKMAEDWLSGLTTGQGAATRLSRCRHLRAARRTPVLAGRPRGGPSRAPAVLAGSQRIPTTPSPQSPPGTLTMMAGGDGPRRRPSTREIPGDDSSGPPGSPGSSGQKPAAYQQDHPGRAGRARSRGAVRTGGRDPAGPAIGGQPARRDRQAQRDQLADRVSRAGLSRYHRRWYRDGQRASRSRYWPGRADPAGADARRGPGHQGRRCDAPARPALHRERQVRAGRAGEAHGHHEDGWRQGADRARPEAG